MKIRLRFVFFVAFSLYLIAFSNIFAFPSSFSARSKFFAGDLFFPVYGSDNSFAVKQDDKSHKNDGKQENDKNQNESENQKERNFLVASGGFLTAKPDLSQLTLDFYSGWGGAGISTEKLELSVGSFGANLPGETKILNKKPRFTLKDGKFSGVFSSASYHFKEDFSISLSMIAANGGFDWGDLYYFYGHPQKSKIYGGKILLEFPFKIDVFAIGGSVEFKLKADNTDAAANLGNAGANLGIFGVKKRFLGEKKERNWWRNLQKTRPLNHHTLDVGALFAYADYFGSLSATPETQTYFFFPYKKIYAHANGEIFAAGGGLSYKYSRASFEGLANAFYIHCFSNPSSANYYYHYKKNLFFDGSSESSNYELADLKNCGFFAGQISLSYDFKNLLHLKKTRPVLKLSRIFAIPVLTDELRGKINKTSSSSASSATSASSSGFISSSSDGGLSVSKSLDRLKTIFLSGTVLSLKIEFD